VRVLVIIPQNTNLPWVFCVFLPTAIRSRFSPYFFHRERINLHLLLYQNTRARLRILHKKPEENGRIGEGPE
jgi:hypothetical protein